MNYAEFRKNTCSGWNTWNVLSVLSHVKLPEGFAINLCLKDFSDGGMLREATVGDGDVKLTPGIRSWDGTYTSLTVEYRETEITVESAVKDGEQYILITPIRRGLRTPLLSVEACLLWGKEGVIGKNGDRLFGTFDGDQTINVYCTSPSVPPIYMHSLSPALGVLLDSEVIVSTKPCTLAEGKTIVLENKRETEEMAAKYGKHAETYTAMKSCLAWDTIYDCQHDRICSPVSRSWSKCWGGYVMFCWDSYFAAIMASIDCPTLAYANAIAITDEATERGFVPNFACTNNVKSRDRSQPPVGSATCLSIYKKYGGEWFLSHVYDTLLGWNRWFFNNRRVEDGYLCWGTDPYKPLSDNRLEKNNVHCWQGAAYESGLDNSPMYDGVEYDEKTHLMMLADVGLMGLYVEDCRALLEISRLLNREEAIEELNARMQAVSQALMTLWNEKDGMFENKNLITGELSPRLSPTNFYALYCPEVTKDQLRAVCDCYFSPSKFHGEYRMPSTPADDPAYHDQDYWRGRVWGPMNYLVYTAFKESGCKAAAEDLAQGSEELFLKEWRLHGHVHENYNAETGMGCGGNGASDPFYHWGGLLGYVAIDADQ